MTTTGPLDGVLIADFGRVLAAPYATMLLADLGADVVKIERPGTGDDTRSWGPPFHEGVATYFQSVNRNKRSVALDLSDPRALELAKKADVVVENFKPGTMARFGLDYESLQKIRPGLVYCSVTGFGGKSDMPGYDLLIQAVGGLMSVTGEADGPPMRTGVALVDVLTGLHAAVGILAALRHRDRTGEGQLVEVDLLSTLLASMVNQSSGYALAGVVPGRMGNRHPSIAPYQVFPAADGELVIAVGNDGQFAALCEVLSLPADPRFAGNTNRVAHSGELAASIAAKTKTRPVNHWIPLLAARGVPCGPVNDLAAAFGLAAQLGLDPIVPLGDGVTVANPIKLSRTPPRYVRRPPHLAEHNLEDR